MVSSAGTLALEEATIADIHAAYRAGTLTVHAVIAACLARIAAYDKDGPYLNSLITVNAQALAVSARKGHDKLYHRHTGYPGGIKTETLEHLAARDIEKVA